MLDQLITRWGYVAVAVGTFVEGEMVLVTAGAICHQGLLSLAPVMAAAFIGSFTGDQFWYWLGRRFGARIIERRERWKARSERAQALLARGGVWFVLGYRFIYGIRAVTPLFLGTTTYPAKRFTLLSAISGAVWATLYAAAGWLVGQSLKALLERGARLEELLGAAVVAAIIVWAAGRLIRRRWARGRTA